MKGAASAVISLLIFHSSVTNTHTFVYAATADTTPNVTTGSPNSSNGELANTGSSQWFILIAAVTFVAIGIGTTLRRKVNAG